MSLKRQFLYCNNSCITKRHRKQLTLLDSGIVIYCHAYLTTMHREFKLTSIRKPELHSAHSNVYPPNNVADDSQITNVYFE